MSDPTQPSADLLTRSDVIAMKPVPATQRFAYGEHAGQWIDAYLPTGNPSPYPGAILLHGGCWRNTVSAAYLGAMGRALAEHGIAAFNVEYRRLGAGGGWPATCLDVAAAIDLIFERSDRFRLAADRVALVGHSAGGHLALWSAARHHLPGGAPGARREALPVRGVVALAGMPDLADAHARGICQDAVQQFLGVDPDRAAEPLALASPAELPPTAAPHLHLVGDLDQVVPAVYVRAAVERMRAAGQATHLSIVPASGHMEPAIPTTGAWPDVLEAIQAAIDGRMAGATPPEPAGPDPAGKDVP